MRSNVFAVWISVGRFEAEPTPLFRELHEVAEAALFFASERSGFCTGSGLVMDGGLDASLI